MFIYLQHWTAVHSEFFCALFMSKTSALIICALVMLCCKTFIENSKQQFWVEWTHNGKLKLWVLRIKFEALDTLMTSVFPLHFTSCYTRTHSHMKKIYKKKELHKTVAPILKHQGCWMSFIKRLLFSPLLGMWWILKIFQVEEGIDYYYYHHHHHHQICTNQK